MKKCPTCNRTYEDTATFCLADGSLLDAPFDTQETLSIPDPRRTEPPPTEVLKSNQETGEEIPPPLAGPQPERKAEESVPPSAAPAPTLTSPKAQDSLIQATGKPQHLLPILIGVGVLVILGLIYFITKNRTPSTAENTNQAGTSNVGNETSNNSVNKNTQPTHTETPSDTTALAPEIELKMLQGGQFRLSQLRGRVVVLNFWATWCGPCREEIPALNALQNELGPRGLEVVGVSWDDTIDDIKNFQKETKLDYMIVLDGETVQDKFGGIPSIPTTYIIDRTGRIRQKIVGARDRNKFNSMVSPLLDETP